MTRQCIALILVAIMLGPTAPALGQDTTAARRLHILVTNDDGFQAPGLRALAEALFSIADITVVAPYEQQSGTGHGISFRDPINVYDLTSSFGIPWHAVNARPASVVRVALFSIMDSLPDLVVSGINTGDNIGTNAWVSGTMGAAREAALWGVPALAFSVNLNGPDPYNVAAGWARQIIEQLEADGRLHAPLLLNVNLQATEPLGIKIAPMSLVMGVQTYDKRTSPSGQEYVWAEWIAPEDDPIEGTDLYWYHRGYVTITPMSVDQTDPAEISTLEMLFRQP